MAFSSCDPSGSLNVTLMMTPTFILLLLMLRIHAPSCALWRSCSSSPTLDRAQSYYDRKNVSLVYKYPRMCLTDVLHELAELFCLTPESDNWKGWKTGCGQNPWIFMNFKVASLNRVGKKDLHSRRQRCTVCYLCAQRVTT